MTRSDRLIRRAAIVGIVVIVGGVSMMTGVGAMVPSASKPQPMPKPFSERMGCMPWEPGLSRSVTVIATEDESGALKGMQCIRTKDRGIARRGM